MKENKLLKKRKYIYYLNRKSTKLRQVNKNRITTERKLMYMWSTNTVLNPFPDKLSATKGENQRGKSKTYKLAS